MRFLEIPALITEDIETPDIVDITEPISASISGTTLTIDGGNKVSGESTITLTSDVNVDTITKTNLREPSIHKISVKTNGKGNFTYTPNTGVTASSVSSTIKTGSDFEILLITTTGGDTYLDLDLADYTSPAVNFDNALTGFDITDLTSTYGATAKLYKPDGTLLSTTSSATTGSGVGFGSGVETTPGDVTYKLEVTDDVGRKSTYNLPRKWINYAMETNSTPGFQKFKIGTNEYTSTTVVPNLSSTTKARVYKTTDHGYLGINFKIQGRNSTSGAWTDIDSTAENVESDESAEFLAFGDYLYQRVWVKPTAQATTTVSSSNVVTLTLSNVTDDVTKTISGHDPYMIDEVSNAFVFDETSRVGTVPFTITLGSETYTDSVSATTEERSVATTPNTDFTAAGSNMKHYIGTSSGNHICEASGDGRYIVYHPTNNDSVMQVVKGDGENGFTNYATFTYSQASTGGKVGSVSYDGKYVLVAQSTSNSYGYEIWKNDESTSTFTKLSQTVNRIGDYNHTYKPSFVPRSGNYDFCVTGTDNNNNFDIQLYKHNAGTDTWTAQTIINDPANRPTGDVYRGFFACQFTRDGKYLMMGAYSTYGGYQMYTIDWDANTAVFSGANYNQNANIGHSGTVTPDGKYVLIFHNDSNSRKIFKNNDAGDWSSATDVTTDFTFADADDDQGNGISFFGEHGEYFVSLKDGGHVRVYQWLDVINKRTTLTYNGKDKLTIAHTGGLTPSSVKLYKDGVLYHTFGTELSVFINETGVYQAISDEKYYSLKVTVTTVTETEARLYVNHATTFLLKKDSKVWYWGESHRGSNAMGNGTEVAVPTLNDNLNALPSGIKQIGHCGTDPHATCAITNDGKLYTWGYNGHGQLGRGNTSDYTSQAPLLVATQSSNTFTMCHSSYYSNFALQDNGYIWSCGYNGQYVLGTGNNSDQATFYRVNLPNVIDIHANYNIALAVTSDSEVYIWGTESNSSMGGASGTTGTPTHLTALDGKNIVKVRTGGYTGHAISSDGKLYSWGKGQYHAVPDGTANNVSTPTEMTWFSRKNIKLVDAQFPYDEAAACLGLDDQGNMYVWGVHEHGGIGDYYPQYSYPWPVLLKTNIASISVGRHSCGCIDKFGQVYTWGDGARGVQNWIHGTNSDTDINIPTSNNLSVGSTLIFDGFDRYVLGKGSTVTSNVTFGSNTVSLDTKSEVFVTDPHTYKFKIMDTDSVTYMSNVVSTVSRPTERVYPPKSGTHKNISHSASANADNTWTIDGALYGNGDYTASMNKNINTSTDTTVYQAFNGMIGYTHVHTDSGNPTAAIQLHMPQKIKLTKYAMYSRNFTSEYDKAPKDWKMYGSNDKTNWTELDSQTNETVTAWGSQLDHRDTKREYTVTGNTKYFSSYKLDVTANGGDGNYVILSQIEYYGDEEGFLSDDGFGKLTLDVKGDTSATSNIVFHSNTYVMGAARDLYITDTGDYTADIFGSNKHFLGSKTHTVSANATEFIWKDNEDQILYSSDIAAADAFGERISIDGNYAVVGARQADPNGTLSGAAYVFYKSGGTWSQQQKLVASDSSANYEFGYCVDISGDTIVVGSGPYDGSPGSDSGKVYVFKRTGTTWTQQAAFQSSDIQTSDYFGWSVSIHGDYIIAGARVEDTGGSDTGSAYIFKRVHQENPDFTANSTLHTDYTSKYGWSSNSGWEVSSKNELNSSSYPTWKAFNKSDASNNNWLSGSAPSTSSPQWLKIKYPSQQVIKSYVIRARSNTSPRYPTAWKLQGANTDIGDTDSGWTDIGTEQTQTIWEQNQSKPFDVSTNTTAYQYYRLRITGTKESATSSNSDYVAIGQWKLFTGTDKTYWTQESKIQASDRQPSDNFGSSVSIHGDYAIVAAYLEDEGGSNAGAAYLYKRDGTTWSQQYKLMASDKQAEDYYGGDTQGVGIYGDYAVVGARLEDSNGSNAGAAYVYKKTTNSISTFVPPDQFINTGSGVGWGTYPFDYQSTSGTKHYYSPNTLGTQYDMYYDTSDSKFYDGNGSNEPHTFSVNGGTADSSAGPAVNGDYVQIFGNSGVLLNSFVMSGWGGESWTQQAKLQASDVQLNSQFGICVSISGDRLVVGANADDRTATDAGAAYIFERSGTNWTEVKKITASDAQASDSFGISVAIDSTNVIVGAYGEDTKGSGAGAAYIFSKAAKAVPALNFDGYNKLSIDNVTDSKVSAIPYFIDNTTVSTGESGWEASESSFQAANNTEGEFKAYKAFDGIINRTVSKDIFHSNNSEQPWIKIKSPNPFTFNQYKLTSRGGDGAMSYTWHPAVWTIDGSNDDSTWTTIDTQNSYHNWGGEGITHTFNVSNTTPYTYYRLNCTDSSQDDGNHNGGNYLCISEWELLKDATLESVTIKKDGAAFATTTSNTVYIRETGTYTAEVKGSSAYVTELSKEVSVTPTHKLDYDSTETTINGDDLDGVDNYGQTMCGYGDTIAIAAPGEDTSVSNSGAVYIWKRTGTTWAQEAKLKSPSPGSAYYFGYAQMSMIENKIAIGEIGANKVHVFTRSGTTWTLAQTLSGSNNFGRGVALYGNHLAVGADTYDSNRGRVHIYTFTGGSPKTSIAITGGIYYTSYTGCYYELDSSQNTENSRFFELKASDGTPQFGTPEIYGFEVRRSGSTYTAYANTGGNTDEPNELSITSISSGMAASVTLPTTGQLYGRKQSNYGTFETESVTWADVFNGSYGSEVTISSPHGNTNTQFGYALSLYGTSLAVGAYADDQKAYQAGRAYIYVYDGSAWTHQASLDDDLVANDYGHEVFLVDADTLMFGNLQANASSGQNGTVYYYTRSGTTWTKHQTITASDGGTGDYFGQKIWATSDTLIVGARNWEGSSGSNRGKIYIYEKENGTWTEKKTYTKVNNALDTDYFGESVWTDGTYFVSGAMDADDKGTNSGSAHVYAKIESGPTLTYDGKNKLTIGGCDYADTSKVTKRGGTTYDIGTAKTMYIKETGDYDLEVSGSDKFAVATVNVGSIDLTGATTKPIDFDGYNKLTFVNAGANAVSNVSLNGGAKQELGSVTTYYIKDTGTYALEMSGSNVFALSSNVVGAGQISTPSVYSSATPTLVDPINITSGVWSSGNYEHYQTHSTYYLYALSLDDDDSDRFIKYDWVTLVWSDQDESGTYSTFGTSATDTTSTARSITNPTHIYLMAGAQLHATMVNPYYQVPNYTPSLTFDGNNKLTVSNFTTTSNEWPPPRPWTTPATTTDSDTTGITGSNSGKDATWTISGAAYGNGVYSATCDTAINSSATNHGPWKMFSKTNVNYPFHTSSVTTCKVELTMPESIVLASYEIFYGDGTVSQGHYPKDWTIEGSNDGTTWTVLDTRTNETYSDGTLHTVNSGRKYTVSGNSTSYNRYRMDVTANGGGAHVTIGEWKLFEKNTRTGTLTDPNGSTYALGQTQDTIYIKDTGDYTLDVTNNDQKAIVTKTVSGPITSPTFPSCSHRFKLEDGTITDDNDSSRTFSSGGSFEAGVLRNDGKTSLKVTPGINKNFTLPSALSDWCVSMWVFIPYITSYGSSNSNDIPSDFSSYTTTFGWNWHAIFTYHMSNSKEFQMKTHYNWILNERANGSTSTGTANFEWKVNSSIGVNSQQVIHPGNNSDNSFWPEAWHHMALEYNGTTGNLTFYIDGNASSTTGTFSTGCSLSGFTLGDNTVYNAQTHNGSSGGSPYPFLYFSDIIINSAYDSEVYTSTKGTYKHFLPIPNPLGVRQLRGEGSESSVAYTGGGPKLKFDDFNKLTIQNVDSDATSNIDFFSNMYEMGSRKELIISDYGTYYANIHSSNTLALTKTKLIPESDSKKVIFHHGAFTASDYSSAYSTVSAAATAGHVYSDTSAGTYTWGTLAHVKERENPDFTANSTLHTDYSSKYGWDTNSGWVVDADTQHDNSEANYGAWRAFSKDKSQFWHSNHGSGVSTSNPAWLEIKYPSAQITTSYEITSRNDNTNTRFPKVWKLQGSVSDGTTWVDIGSEQTETTWSPGTTKSFSVTNTTAYQYYRLYITTTIRSSSATSTSDFAAIAGWKLYTSAAASAPNYTKYTWTPASTGFEDAHVLMVAGGAGGGGNMGGGGGAGGLVYNASQNLSGAKTIVVGNGSSGGIQTGAISNGNDTSFTGLTTAVGGGSGGGGQYGGAGSSIGYHGGNGGSGGGGTSGSSPKLGGTGTSDQGNDGGNGDGGGRGGGGGGAGGAGETGNTSGNDGGTGLDYSSVFGTTCGDSGWFASGGGGGGNADGDASIGGGGGGHGGSAGSGSSAIKHTGGGGGGGGKDNNSGNIGGQGGSGVVIVKTNTVSISDTPANSATYNLKYLLTTQAGGTNQGYNRATELSIVNGLGTHTWSKTGSITDKNGTEYDWMFIGEEGSTSTTALTTVALPYTVTTTVVTGTSPASGYTDRIWNGRASSTDNSEQKQLFSVNDICEIQGTYTSAIAPTYLLIGFTTGAKDNLEQSHVKVVDVIVSGKTYFSIDLGTTYGIAGALMENYPSSSGNASLFAIKLPNKLFGLPELKFDGYNKLTAPILDPSFTAARISDWDNSNQSKTMVTGGGDWPDATMTHHQVLQNGDKSYQHTDGGASRDAAQLFTTVISGDWGNASHGQAIHSPMWFGYKFTEGKKSVSKMILTQPPGNSHTTGNVFIKYWDGSAMVSVNNQSPAAMSSQSYNSSTTFTFDSVRSQYWQIDCYKGSSNSTTYTALHGWQLLSGRDPVATVLTKGSDSYDIGTARNVYIDAMGTYDAQATNSNTFVIKTSNTVSGTLTRKREWKSDGTESKILFADDQDTNTQLGYGCDISGDYMIGGAPQDDEGGSGSGAAYIFYKSGGTWTQQAKLRASDPDSDDQFGEFCEISGDYAIVGNYQEDAGGTSAGAAYIFKRTGTTWAQQAKLTASDAAANDKLGWGVSIDGDYAIAGAHGDGSGAGSAYIFKRSGTSWSQEAKITADNAGGGDYFGYDVTISGDYAAVGSIYEDTTASDAGSVYIFKKETGDFTTSSQPGLGSISGSTQFTGDTFALVPSKSTSTKLYYEPWTDATTHAITVTKSGSNYVINVNDTGATGNPANVSGPGGSAASTATVSAGDTVTIYDSTGNSGTFTMPTLNGPGWSQQQRIQSSDIATNDNFGGAVAMDGDYLAVSAPYDNSNYGAVYFFKKETTSLNTVGHTIEDEHTAYYGDSDWICQSVSGTVGIYKHIYANGNDVDAPSGGVGNNTIQYDSSTSTWSDYGAGQPVKFTKNDTDWNNRSSTVTNVQAGDVIRGWKDNTNAQRGQFTQPASGNFDIWTQQSKIIPSGVGSNDQAGNIGALSISGDTVVMGSYFHDTGGVSDSGTAYIFERSGTTWSEVKKLSASDKGSGYRFGQSVGVSGNTAVVGSAYSDQTHTNNGALYVFEKSEVGPTLTYDDSNKLSLSGVTTPSTNLTFGTRTFDIGATKDVYISEQGTYNFHTNDGNQSLIMSNVVSSDPSTSGGGAGPDTPLAFHHGTFADSEDPHGDGSVSAAAKNGHVYSDTPTGSYTWGTLTSCEITAMTGNSYSDENWAYGENGTVPTAGFTTYKWTPVSAITNGRTLVVAGGGGGGTDMGGGAGAGGLLASTTTNIAKEEQTIQVGDGGARGYDPNGTHRHQGGNGADSSISGASITAIGGGGGASGHDYNNRPAGNGGSGGGGSGGTTYSGSHGGDRGTGTSGQGYDGARSGYAWYPAGGGGAGGMGHGRDGQSGSNSVPHGGDGVENDILGTNYWWAGGGGGNGHSVTAGTGGKGGGGGGAHYNSSTQPTNGTNGLTTGEIPVGTGNSAQNSGGSGGKHTGGGGGGGDHNDQTDIKKMRGGRGGSGIVVIVAPTISLANPSQVYDTSNTFTISNIPSGTSTVGKIYKGATAYTIHATQPTSNVVIKNTGSYLSVFTTSSAAYLTNAITVSSTPDVGDNTIEDEVEETTVEVSATIAFHDGTFADSDDPHSDGSVTAAATAGHVYSDTAAGTYTWGTLTSCERTAMANNLHSDEDFAYNNNGTKPTAGFTTYKWTPPGAITNGRTLLVAGGGGGGADMGGGGGAGGMLASTTTNIAHAEQTIQVGGGGARGYDPSDAHRAAGGNGADSSISGPGITAIGGGGGATEHSANNPCPAGSGGSGGGASGARSSNNGSVHGTGTSGQGHDGGSSGNHWYMGGGGGAGAVGGSGNSSGHGGDGLEDDILGTSYWWAGGGGSNTHHPSYYDGNKIRGGKGGGGSGAPCHSGHGGVTTTIDTNGITNAGAATPQSGQWNYHSGGSGGKHTGGGGGGGDYHGNGVTHGRGGKGGSGIVAIKFTALGGTKGIAGSTAIASTGSGTTGDTPSLTLDATTEAATPTLDLNFTTAMTSFPKTIGRYNISTHDTLGVEFDRTATRKKRVKKTINTDKFSMQLTANNAASGTIGDLVTFGNFTLTANTTTSGEHKIATNFDGTTSNVYVNGELVTQTTPTVTSGAKLLTIGEYYAGRIKDFKFWNLAKQFFLEFRVAFHQGTFSDGGDPYSHGSVAAAATAGYVYSDTATGTYMWGTLTSGTDTTATGTPQGLNFVAAYTTYSWTPPNALTGARTLCVAGGGGGGADTGGGGGAGGYLEASDQYMSGTQTIIVGGGGDGIRRNYNDSCYHGGNGGDSSISGTSQTSIGGGGGGSRHDTNGSNHEATSGGSGGGASGTAGSVGGAGTGGQGYEGASSSTSHYCCGGGGASEAGTWGATSGAQADGGDGKQSDILGTAYYWSGGGGGAEHSNSKGSGGKGGGGVGAWGAGTSTVGGSPDTNGVSDAETTPGSDGNWHQRGGNAGKHTGGGGGGGSHHNAGGGGHGGSGMVIISTF